MQKWIDLALFLLGSYAVVFVIIFILNWQKDVDEIAFYAFVFSLLAFVGLSFFGSGGGSDGDSTGRSPTNM